jgi:murein DD-endopeptidase MepM/ murein hydrolase activator NlpD
MSQRTTVQSTPHEASTPRRPGSRRAVGRGALAAFVAAALVVGLTAPVLADKKDDLQREKRGVNGKIDGAQRSLDSSSAAYAKAAKALDAAQGKLASARATLGKTRGQLAVSQAEDARMQAELERSQARLDKAVADLKAGERRLRKSEDEVAAFTVETVQDGDRGMRAFGELLGGESPSTFTDRMSLNASVGDAQVSRMQKLAAAKVMLRLNRDKVEELRDQVAVAREEAAANLRRMTALEAAAQEQADEVGELVAVRAEASSKAKSARAEDARILAAYESERDRLNRQLAELARRELERQRRAAAGRGGGGGGGGSSSGGDGGGTLSYPVNAPITSPYGMRVHPVTGVYKLHDGTDFGAACGTPIRAAASGTIIQQYYNAGYGNRVILANGIKRGQSIVTTYNHLSSFARGAGARVSRGEVIGYVGSTGYSTGCHLHFMVISNGATVNPMGWL